MNFLDNGIYEVECDYINRAILCSNITTMSLVIREGKVVTIYAEKNPCQG